MPISSGGPPKINGRPSHPVGRILPQQMIRLRGKSFRLRLIRITLDLFTSLGFNPRRFTDGANIMSMTPAEYRRLENVFDFEKSAGIYPLATNGDLPALHRGELAYLPNRSRNIVLPSNHEPITLAHELLHDIFIGGGIEALERVEFTKSILFLYRLAMDPKMKHQHKNRPFFEKVAEVCAEKYNIENIDTRYNFRSHHKEEDFQIFAGECFAYAGEFLLHPQESMIEAVPEGLVRIFRYIRVFDRSVYQRADEQA